MALRREPEDLELRRQYQSAGAAVLGRRGAVAGSVLPAKSWNVRTWSRRIGYFE